MFNSEYVYKKLENMSLKVEDQYLQTLRIQSSLLTVRIGWLPIQ